MTPQTVILWDSITATGDRHSSHTTWKSYINSLRPSDAIWWHLTGCTLAQVMAWYLATPEPLPEPVLTYREWDSLTFTREQFQKGYINHQSLKLAWKLLSLNFIQISQGCTWVVVTGWIWPNAHTFIEFSTCFNDNEDEQSLIQSSAPYIVSLWEKPTDHRRIPLTLQSTICMELCCFPSASLIKLLNEQSSCAWFETTRGSCGITADIWLFFRKWRIHKLR